MKMHFPVEEHWCKDADVFYYFLHLGIGNSWTNSCRPPSKCVSREMQLDVLWYFLSSISPGARLSGVPGRWWCSVGLSLPLICSHTADSQGACHRGRGERGLKCSARYSKRCLINNVSERTRWDTAGLLCLSQAHTHTHMYTHTFGKRLIKPPPPSPLFQRSPHPKLLSIFRYRSRRERSRK